jgi:hypothetical protein
MKRRVHRGRSDVGTAAANALLGRSRFHRIRGFYLP